MARAHQYLVYDVSDPRRPRQVQALATDTTFRPHWISREPGTDRLVLTSGAHRVDTAATAARIGVERLQRASPEFVRQHTGQVIGGVSPIGHPAPIPTYVDTWLQRHPVVWAAAGHPATVFSTTYDELLALTGATTVDVEG